MSLQSVRQLPMQTRTISSIKRHMGTDYRVDIDGKEIFSAGDFRNDPSEAESRCRELSWEKR